jgi:uncharacterized protein (DUF927 family)
MATCETHTPDTLDVGPEEVPSVDREAIRNSIGPLHELATSYAQSGRLVVSYQDARRVDEKGSFKQARYAIGPEHAERMVDEIIRLASNPFTNVWVELDAPKRGKKSETLAVLALAVDDDVDSGKGSAVLPVEPSRVLQTSEKNRQQQFSFKEPLAPDAADRLGKKLRKLAGADACTGSCAQPYRIAGTPNWPTAKKVKERGRSPIPFLVREVGSPGEAVDAMEFEEALDAELAKHVGAKVDADGDPRPHDQGKAGKPELRHLKQRERHLLQHGGNDSIDRSRVWQSACWQLFKKGFSVESVAEFFQPFAKNCPDGFAAKYTGRIDVEVQRSYDKFLERETRRGARRTSDEGPKDSGRMTWLPRGFWVADHAIFTEIEAQEEVLEVRVCSVFEFIGVAVPDKLDPHRTHRALIPRAQLADNGKAYRETLLGLGLEIPSYEWARAKLHELLNKLQRTHDLRIVTQTGWHGKNFVTRHSVVKAPGDRAEFIHHLTVESSAEPAASGTLSDWNARIGSFIEPNSTFVAAVCQTMSGPVLKLTDDPSSVVHLIGDSSIGKTAILQVALSPASKPVFGIGLETWRATDNALENALAARNDLCLGLDEMSQISPKAASQVAYMIAQGSGKIRMAHNSEPRPTRRWRCSVLSTGEIDLETKLAEAGEMARAGQEVRVIGVPANAGKGFGAFDTLCGKDSGEELAKYLQKASLETYGSPMAEWIHRLVYEREQQVEKIRARRQLYRAKLQPKQMGPVSGQVARVADHFALLAAVGETLIDLNIFNWNPGTALNAVKVVFDRWVVARGGVGPAEHKQILQALRRAVELRRQAFLPMRNLPENKPSEILGYIDGERADESDRRRRVGPRRVMLTVSGFAKVFSGLRREAVITYMSDNGFLLPGNSETTITVRPEGEPNVRVYAFDLQRVLGGSDLENTSAEDKRAAEERRTGGGRVMPLRGLSDEVLQGVEHARALSPGALLDEHAELSAKLMLDCRQRDHAENEAASMLGYAEPDALYLEVVRQWMGLMQVPPRSTPLGRRLVDFSEVFLRSAWALKALRVGWDELDLFGVHPTHPNIRLDAQGLVPSIALSSFQLKIAMLTADTAVFRTESGSSLRHARQLSNDDAVPLWECTAAFPATS